MNGVSAFGVKRTLGLEAAFTRNSWRSLSSLRAGLGFRYTQVKVPLKSLMLQG